MSNSSINQNIVKESIIATSNNGSNIEDFNDIVKDTKKYAQDTEILAKAATITADNDERLSQALVPNKGQQIKISGHIDRLLFGNTDNSNDIKDKIISSFNHSEAADNLANEADDLPIAISKWLNSDKTQADTAILKRETTEIVDAAKVSVETAKENISKAEEFSYESLKENAELNLEKAEEILLNAKLTRMRVGYIIDNYGK